MKTTKRVLAPLPKDANWPWEMEQLAKKSADLIGQQMRQIHLDHMRKQLLDEKAKELTSLVDKAVIDSFFGKK